VGVAVGAHQVRRLECPRGAELLPGARQIQPGQITTVWKSEVIPGAPMVISNRLSPALRQQLTTAVQQKANADYLRANSFCQGECGIADDDAYGYVATNDAFYDSLREVCRIVQHDSCTER
jgi:phosphonate transport system substrate-binding protein